MQLYDIHAHILPGVDNGPRSLDEALRVIAALASEGVGEIVATPHQSVAGETPPAPDAPPDAPPAPVRRLSVAETQERVEALQRIARQAGLPVRLRAGHEAPAPEDDAALEQVEAALARGALATLNDGPYALVALPNEFGDARLAAGLRDFTLRLRIRGIIPIFSHVERSRTVRRAPDALAPLIEAGALAQITATSLIGAYGPSARRAAETLLQRNLAHALASGAHIVTQTSQAHPLRYGEALRAAERLVGPRRARELAVDAPRAIVAGQPVPLPEIVEATRRRARGYLARGGW